MNDETKTLDPQVIKALHVIDRFRDRVIEMGATQVALAAVNEEGDSKSDLCVPVDRKNRVGLLGALDYTHHLVGEFMWRGITNDWLNEERRLTSSGLRRQSGEWVTPTKEF